MLMGRVKAAIREKRLRTAAGKGGQEDLEQRERRAAERKTLKCPLVEEERGKRRRRLCADSAAPAL